MSNVTKLYPKNSADNPDNVLEQSIGEYESVFILGFDKDGDLDIRASTNLTQERILWMMKQFEHNMMNGDYNDEDDNQL